MELVDSAAPAIRTPVLISTNVVFAGNFVDNLPLPGGDGAPTGLSMRLKPMPSGTGSAEHG